MRENFEQLVNDCDELLIDLIIIFILNTWKKINNKGQEAIPTPTKCKTQRAIMTR